MTDHLARGSRSLRQALAIFLLAFFAMQFGWSQARGTRLERWVIDYATVRTSVTLINTLAPQTAAVASGASLLSPDGGINIRNGCEGTEGLFLLVAGLLAYPFSWRTRLIGLLTGTAFIFVVNQLRLLALFYSIRNDRVLFEHLHGLIAPLALVASTVMFFVALRAWDQRLRMAAQASSQPQ